MLVDKVGNRKHHLKLASGVLVANQHVLQVQRDPQNGLCRSSTANPAYCGRWYAHVRLRRQVFEPQSSLLPEFRHEPHGAGRRREVQKNVGVGHDLLEEKSAQADLERPSKVNFKNPGV